MAKKKASKSRSKKNTSNDKAGNGFIIVIIIIVLAAAAYLGIQKSGGIDNIELPKLEALQKQIPKKPENKLEKVEPAENPKRTKTDPGTTFDRGSIDDLDGKLEEEKTNRAVPSYNTENEYYYTSTFDFGWPTYSQSDNIVEHDYFTLSYNEKTEQANWVAYKLTADNLGNAQFKRRDNFRADPSVNTRSAHPDDYKGSGYDRGHLAPAADFTWTKDGLDDTFFMSNMSPQDPAFNRGIWKKLEEKVRAYAQKNTEVFVVTGPIFDGRSPKIGKNKVAVPDQYYKVILEMTGKDVKGIGFILDNEKSSAPLVEYALSIDEVERITGYDFFPLLPDDLESKIECCARYSDW